jgi:hypothetical protein
MCWEGFVAMDQLLETWRLTPNRPQTPRSEHGWAAHRRGGCTPSTAMEAITERREVVEATDCEQSDTESGPSEQGDWDADSEDGAACLLPEAPVAHTQPLWISLLTPHGPA